MKVESSKVDDLPQLAPVGCDELALFAVPLVLKIQQGMIWKSLHDVGIYRMVWG